MDSERVDEYEWIDSPQLAFISMFLCYIFVWQFYHVIMSGAIPIEEYRVDRPEDLTHATLTAEFHDTIEDEHRERLLRWYGSEERAIKGYIQAKRGMWGLPFHEVAKDEQVKKENMEAQNEGQVVPKVRKQKDKKTPHIHK